MIYSTLYHTPYTVHSNLVELYMFFWSPFLSLLRVTSGKSSWRIVCSLLKKQWLTVSAKRARTIFYSLSSFAHFLRLVRWPSPKAVPAGCTILVDSSPHRTYYFHSCVWQPFVLRPNRCWRSKHVVRADKSWTGCLAYSVRARRGDCCRECPWLEFGWSQWSFGSKFSLAAPNSLHVWWTKRHWPRCNVESSH